MPRGVRYVSTSSRPDGSSLPSIVLLETLATWCEVFCVALRSSDKCEAIVIGYIKSELQSANDARKMSE